MNNGIKGKGGIKNKEKNTAMNTYEPAKGIRLESLAKISGSCANKKDKNADSYSLLMWIMEYLRKLDVGRPRSCTKCKGKGSLPGDIPCCTCNGKGGSTAFCFSFLRMFKRAISVAVKSDDIKQKISGPQVISEGKIVKVEGIVPKLRKLAGIIKIYEAHAAQKAEQGAIADSDKFLEDARDTLKKAEAAVEKQKADFEKLGEKNILVQTLYGADAKDVLDWIDFFEIANTFIVAAEVAQDKLVRLNDKRNKQIAEDKRKEAAKEIAKEKAARKKEAKKLDKVLQKARKKNKKDKKKKGNKKNAKKQPPKPAQDTPSGGKPEPEAEEGTTQSREMWPKTDSN